MKIFNKETWAVGLAMFSMFFGAGNIIFPLALGQLAGDKNGFAILGLVLTGVFVPFAGVLAMIMFNGDQQRFFGRLGKVPGFLIAFMVIALLGPLGSTPRCIALSYTTFQSFLPGISAPLFGISACIVIYLFAASQKRLLKLLGVVLTPLLLISLISIIVLGFAFPADLAKVDDARFELFLTGLKEGYNTMDLLAAFFFSSTIWALLKGRENRNRISIGASLIAMTLLIIVYGGFSYIAAMHGELLMKDEILSAITFKLAGPYGGILVCIAIGLACLTTAIALISSFSEFVHKEVFRERLSYKIILAGSLLITFVVSTLNFNGISAFLGPILQIIYPGLIVLTIFNIISVKKTKVLI